MFELNESMRVHHETFLGSDVYVIDDFYRAPREIVDMLKANEPPVWKSEDVAAGRSYNTVHFDDRRHRIRTAEVTPVYDFVSRLCGERSGEDDMVYTNFTRFRRVPFNDYQNCYWWPHVDAGYNAIVYLNDNGVDAGTNLYAIKSKPASKPDSKPDSKLEYTEPEHMSPWRPRDGFEVIKAFRSQFNRMVLFDGARFYHGMKIDDDYYFDGQERRMNQVLFMDRDMRA